MYKTEEARSLLRPVQADPDPAKRSAAARALLNAVESVVKAYGFECTWTSSNGRDVLSMRRPNVRLSNAWALEDDGDVMVGTNTPANKAPIRAPVAYDAFADAYLGTEEDTFYVPLPGEPKKRERDAVAAVVAIIKGWLKYPPDP